MSYLRSPQKVVARSNVTKLKHMKMTYSITKLSRDFCAENCHSHTFLELHSIWATPDFWFHLKLEVSNIMDYWSIFATKYVKSILIWHSDLFHYVSILHTKVLVYMCARSLIIISDICACVLDHNIMFWG